MIRVPRHYPKLSLPEERTLIARAQKGSKESADELVLRHIGFVVFRLHKRGFRDFASRYGEDVVSESIPLLDKQIKTYNLRHRHRGKPKPVKFATYIWKRIDGFIEDSLKRELARGRREVSTEYEEMSRA